MFQKGSGLEGIIHPRPLEHDRDGTSVSLLFALTDDRSSSFPVIREWDFEATPHVSTRVAF